MGAVADPRYIERIQGDIKAGCEKLEEYGYESLVIIVCRDKDDTYITGSQRGTGFLETERFIVPDFTQFCVGNSLLEDKKSEKNKQKMVNSILGRIKSGGSSLFNEVAPIAGGSSLANTLAPKNGDPEPMFDDDEDADDYDDTLNFFPLSDDIGKDQKGNVGETNNTKERDSGLKVAKRISAENEEFKEINASKKLLNRLSDKRLAKENETELEVSESKQDDEAEISVKVEIDSGLNDFEDEGEMKALVSDNFDDPAEDLECHFCLKVFGTSDALTVHVDHKHEKNRKDIKCPHCGKPCESSICLGDHLSKIHSNRVGAGKEAYPCSQCRFIFSYRTHLVEHNQRNSKCKEMAESQKGSNEIKDNILESKITFEDKATGNMLTKTVKDLINTKKVNTCEICSRSFDRTYSFRRHIFHHSTAKHFQCNICLCEFNMEEAMKRHWKLHDSKPYYCFNCYERYESRHRLNYHTSMSCKMMPVKPELKCKECGQQTVSKSALEQHKLSCSGVGGSSTCEHCGRQLINMASLRRHIIRYHTEETPYKCSVCPKAYKTKDTLNRHMPVHGEKKFKCSLCEYATTDSRNLMKHKGTHSGDKPYICDYCAKAYTRKASLDNHRRIHTGERPFKCDFEGCGKAFRNKENLRQHQCYHASDYKHVCDFCGRKFKVLGAYKHHRRYHTIEFRWQCDYCEEKFKSRMTYKTHIIKKHPEKMDETEEKHNCKFYRCNICPRIFSMPEHLSEHNNIHLGLKPIKCRLCGKGFSSKGNMLQHEKSHTGGKKYRCSLCPKSYSMPETFQGHLERRHGQKVDLGALKQYQAEPGDDARESTRRTGNRAQKRVIKPEAARPSIPPSLRQIPGLMELETYDATAFIPVLPQITREAFKMNSDY